MRECPNCDSLIEFDAFTCPQCLAVDFGWADHCRALSDHPNRRFLREYTFAEQLRAHSSSSNGSYKVGLSAFSDSGELGYHLDRIRRMLSGDLFSKLKVILDATCWGYEWDYSSDSDSERDLYLPPSLPLPTLVEVSRFLKALFAWKSPKLEIQLILPPRSHPATSLIEKTRLLSVPPGSIVTYADHAIKPAIQQGCDDVFVPLTRIGADTHGQLTASFHQEFDRLADAGYFKAEHSSALRRVVMEAAENADIWGGGGWVCCFLRQEKRGSGGFGHEQGFFVPAKHTHLFLHVFSIGLSLADTTSEANEWNAASSITTGHSSRLSGGGRGMPAILSTVIESSWGTVLLSSGNYTRIITPDGLTREYHSAGSNYLPGVHLCAIVPLAIIAEIQSSLKVPS